MVNRRSRSKKKFFFESDYILVYKYLHIFAQKFQMTIMQQRLTPRDPICSFLNF